VRNDADYLAFIAESIQLIAAYTAPGREHFLNDVANQDQVLRRLEVLADATGQLSEKLRSAHPEIDWPAITGFRNRVAHGYLDVNLDLVWQAVELLPELQQVIDDELGRGGQ